MTDIPQWWTRPRTVSVLVDNPSWILPHAQTLVDLLNQQGDQAILCRRHDEIKTDGVAFLLGCIHLTPPQVLARNHRNLVVHESALPKGKGFSPLTWQILEGRSEIPISLIEAVDAVDSGNLVLTDTLIFEGHELVSELRQAQGQATVALCRKFLDCDHPLAGTPQQGSDSLYPRRRPEDSRLDVDRSLLDQFNLLRVVDNDNYPAFFDHAGHRYLLKIEKMPAPDKPGDVD